MTYDATVTTNNNGGVVLSETTTYATVEEAQAVLNLLDSELQRDNVTLSILQNRYNQKQQKRTALWTYLTAI